MTERDLITHVASVSGSGVSRRGFLTAGALATLGASTLLAACSSDKKSNNADKSSKPVKTGPNAFQGVTLNVGCNPTGVQPAQAAGALWAAKTGGKVNAVVIPYAERATDYATMIVSKDPHFDVLFGSVDFVSNFGDRIYDDLGDLGGITKDLIPAALNQLKKGGKLYAAPLFADMEFFIYNKQDWKDAGLDPEKVPTTWSELYDLAPKLNTGGRAANVTPWNTIGVPYWISMYNSLGGQMFNDDKTEVLFDNDKALKTWQTVEDGFKKQFFGIAAANATGDADTQLLFNQNLGASEINTAGFWSQVLGSDPAFKLKIKKEDVGVVIMPGIDPGTSGSVIVAEGLGVNKFGKNKDAALDFVKYTVSPDVQKQLVLGKAGTVLPTSSISVSGDKDVAASFPIAPLLAEQSKHQLTWPGNAPFNWNAPFLLGLTNISKGTWDAANAQSETVKAVKKLVVDYIASN
jgi:ABC-type glycerol-3-phosphate transport system substrate-binding protein